MTKFSELYLEYNTMCEVVSVDEISKWLMNCFWLTSVVAKF